MNDGFAQLMLATPDVEEFVLLFSSSNGSSLQEVVIEDNELVLRSLPSIYLGSVGGGGTVVITGHTSSATIGLPSLSETLSTWLFSLRLGGGGGGG